MNACDVILHWRTHVDPPPGFDPQLQPISNPGTIVEDGGLAEPTTIRAFVHYVDIATSGFQRFQEVQGGDVILDILATTNLTGKPDLRFEIDGIHYAQKPLSRELAESWDVRMGDSAVFRTLLLRRVE